MAQPKGAALHVLLKNSVSQMIYKHAISTVVPSRAVKITEEEES